MSIKSINEITLPPNLLQGTSVEFLKTLDCQDEATFFEYFQQLNLEDVKQARQKSEKIQEKNRELALQNSEEEPKFTQRKEELRLRVTEAQKLKDEYEKEFLELKKFQNRTELATVRKELQEATKTSEQTSEDMASGFVSGKTSYSVEDFIEKLLEQRTEYWLRKVKLEKFDELSKNRTPRPTPRTRGAHRSEPSQVPTPYPPASQPMPMQSLPVGRPVPNYPQSPRRASDTPLATSLPPAPYPPGNVSRPPQHPMPGHPFPAAAFSRPYYPAQPPPLRPSYPPPRPAPYSQYSQHRY